MKDVYGKKYWKIGKKFRKKIWWYFFKKNFFNFFSSKIGFKFFFLQNKIRLKADELIWDWMIRMKSNQKLHLLPSVKTVKTFSSFEFFSKNFRIGPDYPQYYYQALRNHWTLKINCWILIWIHLLITYTLAWR